MKWQDVVREVSERESRIEYLKKEQERLGADVEAVEDELEKLDRDSFVAEEEIEDVFEMLKTTEVGEIIKAAERCGFESYIVSNFQIEKGEDGDYYGLSPLYFRREVPLDAFKTIPKNRAESIPVAGGTDYSDEEAQSIVSYHQLNDEVKCYEHFSCDLNLDSKGKIIEEIGIDEEKEDPKYTHVMRIDKPWLFLKWPDGYKEYYPLFGAMPEIDLHIEDFPNKLNNLFSVVTDVLEKAERGDGYNFLIMEFIYKDAGTVMVSRRTSS